MEQSFKVTSAPHIVARHSISTMMGETILALLPAGIGAVMFFGWYTAKVILVSVITAVAAEYFTNVLRKQKPTVTNLSCVVTGLLLAYTLPPRIPLWIVCIGAFVGIVFGKQVFGGIGFNPFNPALVARAFLQVSFPQHMINFSYDGITSATPLTVLKLNLTNTLPSVENLLVGNYPASLGETSVILLTLGYLYLVIKRHIHPLPTMIYILIVGIFTIFVSPRNLWIYLFSGGLFLGAIFMITDPVTTPVSLKGKIVFAIGCGILTSLIRFWGGYPEGVCFSILFMNLLTPIIDNLTVRKKFGEVKVKE